ncbi:MAG: hypothetical protein H0W88_02120 [Parachlamydiaceae bacterium]|nr:hypothetical protein [Parachlamydiaceae bacterium]
MRIQIAERLRPYSHLPGTRLLLSGTSYCLEIFPALIRIYAIETNNLRLIEQIHLHIIGPVQEFTILQDLENGKVTVWGHALNGFIRYHILSEKDGKGVRLIVEKGPVEGIQIRFHETYSRLLLAKESLDFFVKTNEFSLSSPIQGSRLSLGNHKAQDWNLVKRRLDLTEILPVWNRLGELTPSISLNDVEFSSNLILLKNCEELIRMEKREEIVQSFKNLFQAGFSDLLVPRLVDNQHHGFIPEGKITPMFTVSPLVLLSEGSRLIRSLFVQQQGSEIKILPVLPPEFHCGRIIQLNIQGGNLSIEWTKKTIRRLIFYSTENQTCNFVFRKVNEYRLKRNEQDKGQIVSKDTPIATEKNCYYFFDNFK